MNAPHRLTLALPLVLALLAGCSTQRTLNGPADPAAATSQDQADVSSTLAENPSYVSDDVSETPDQTDMSTAAAANGASGSLSAQAAVRPLTFWRDIRNVERDVRFDFLDPDTSGRPATAIVTVHRIMRGSFNLLVSDIVPEGNPPSAHVIKKPLVDDAVRRLRLKRIALPGSGRPVWRLVATSGVKITSRGATSRIDSLRIQSGALDTTVTEPLAFFRLRGILKLEAGAQVTLTATTLRSDDVVLLYLRDHRVPFHNNGDNTYTAVFAAPDFDGLHHLGVNVLSHGTLFDDQAGYDSQAWIEPYLVHPVPIADGTPDE
jgi:hypothetical protein